MIDTAALFGLRVATPRLTLRVGIDGEMRELGGLAQRGIHPPEEMPFSDAWSDRLGVPRFLEGFETFHATAGGVAAGRWHLDLLVWVGGELVGTQGSSRRGSPRRGGVYRIVARARLQGRGIGTEMRTAVLELAFTGLGATAAVSEWLDGNAKSERVSERLGYRPVRERDRQPEGHSRRPITTSASSAQVGGHRSRS